MSDFFRPATTPVARTQYRCIGCYLAIQAGEKYHRQSGIYDGRWFVNQLHLECAEALIEDSDGHDQEFTPGKLDPPERLRRAA